MNTKDVNFYKNLDLLFPVEIHIDGKSFFEAHKSVYRRNFSRIIYSNINSNINRKQFRYWIRRYWEEQWDSGRFDK